MNAAAVLAPQDVYLRTYLAPFAPWLERGDVSEILVNRPGELWIETAGARGMERVLVPAIDDRLLERLATQVARWTFQGVNRQSPLLAATLPGGERLQMVGPPATRAGWALAIRRHRLADLTLDAFRKGPLPPPAPPPSPQALDEAARQDPIGFLQTAVAQRKTILISGGTSSGKTTFLNALLRTAPAEDRIVLVEDAPELALSQPNALGLVAVKGDEGEARVDVDDLLQAALRLRPDRIILGEMRGREAATFLRAINTGHPGSLSTVHASTPRGALEQIALMTMQAGLSLSRRETIDYVATMVDVVVQLGRIGGERRILDILSLNCGAER